MCLQKVYRLRYIGIYEDNDPEKPRYEYGKSFFDADKYTVCSVDNNQNVNNDFEINNIKYCLNEKDLTNLQSQGRDAHTIDTNSLSHMYNLDPAKIKQLQQQHKYISKIFNKGKPKKNEKKTTLLP